jgi:PKD repeat protein
MDLKNSRMKKIVFSLLFISNLWSGIAQNRSYVDLMGDKDATFNEVQAAFNDYWRGKTPGKGEGFKAFKRYEDFIKNRINPESGKFDNFTDAYAEYKKYFNTSNTANKSAVSQSIWTPIKPTLSFPSGSGAGRINCIAIHPNNSLIMFVGAPVGGIWRTYDGGQTWACNSDDFASLGISDIAFNPKNPNIVYAASGDRDAGDSYAIGILKSIDGGLSWNPTGISFSTSSNKTFSRILIHPDNPDTVLVAGSDGIYKTINGGTSWILKHSGMIKDMEFKPGDPNTVYASYQSVFKSVNNGESFGTVSGIISPTRIAIAVTPANPNYVYALVANGTRGFQGLYRSSNSAGSFTLRTSTPYILNWDEFGGGSNTGQAEYDLGLAASPINADEIYTGGVNLWKSIDGGITMNCNGHWYGAGGLPYVHADIHDIVFNSAGDAFVGCDGGVFASNDGGGTWNDNSNGLGIGQIYRLSTSQTDTNITITGWQDNGTNLYKNNAASRVIGGDGMDCQINHLNSNFMYGALYYGEISRSTNKGNSFNQIVNSSGTGVNSQGAWVTPYLLDPSNPSTMYVGKSQVYVSNNSGTTWVQSGTISGAADINQLAVSNSTIAANRFIYASKGTSLYVKKGAAPNFVNITNNLFPIGGNITDIEVAYNDSSKVWVTFSSYTNSTVFYSTDAGSTWSNISLGLPQVPATAIISERNSNNLYIGTDIGVFYKDVNSSGWVPYGINLPNVVITDMDIQYPTGKLRVATYGRGLWEIKLFQVPTSAPSVAFSASSQTACQTLPVIFTDNSTNFPTSRTWTFQGGTPATSSVYSPSVIYNAPGVYPVKLVVSNAIGADSITQTNYITVNPAPNITLDSNSIAKCKFDDTVTVIATGGVNYTWQPPFGISSVSNGVFKCFSQNAATYGIKGYDAAGCYTQQVLTVTLKAPPSAISIASIAGGFKAVTSNPAATSTFQWFVNGTAIPGANNDTLLTTGAGAYTCRITIANGCTRTALPINFSTLNAVAKTQLIFEIMPNPNTGKFVINVEAKDRISQLQITDVLGRKIAEFKVAANQLNKTLSIENSGIYFVSLLNESGKNMGTKKVIVE